MTSTLYYDDCTADAMKPLVTVDQSQIIDLAQQSQNLGSCCWFGGELAAGMTATAEDGRRNASTAAVSSQSPVKPVVPLVVEDKEAEEDDDVVDVRLPPTRRRGDRVPAAMTTPAASLTSPSSSPRHPAHQPYAFSPAAFPGHGGFQQPFVPLSVATPRDDQPQTVPCDVVADTHRLQRKRERNRVAAQRCRQRKVEQITMLQERVEDLSRTKAELERTAEQLRRQVDLLQRHLNQHVNSGCQLTSRTVRASTFPARL